MKRLAHFSLYSARQEVDPAVEYFLAELSNYCDIFVSVNGYINSDSISKINLYVKEIIFRPNQGLDVEAHREFIKNFGLKEISNYDEFLLLNHTCFGPIYPFNELFTEMDSRECDIWGVMAHKEMAPNPFTGIGVMPFHINANFIVFRKNIVSSKYFEEYWKNLQNIDTYVEAVQFHESIITKYFTDRGFNVSTYIEMEKYGSRYPGMFDIDETIADRNPLLKRRAFFHDPRYLESEGGDLPRALRLVRDKSSYDLSLIWRSIARSGQLRSINTNAALTHVLSDNPSQNFKLKLKGRIAICAHVYYVDMMPEILAYSANMPVIYDLIITTDSVSKKNEIEKAAVGGTQKNLIVIVMNQNRGRDMAALFISCRDLFLSGVYSLVCRVHTKKSPQIISTKGNLFKRHLLDNLLYTKGYINNVIELFQDNLALGIAVPPLVNISFNHFGHAWYNNKYRVEMLAKNLGLKVDVDDDTPIAIFGTMFWFRPESIRLLFEYEWKWEDFSPEPYHIDGSLAHALERLTCYVAQDRGYLTYQIMNTDYAGQNYAWLEYKLQKVLGNLPLTEFNRQVDMLSSWKESGYPMAYGNAVNSAGNAVPSMTLGTLCRTFGSALRRSFVFRYPKAAYFLRPSYRYGRSLFRK